MRSLAVAFGAALVLASGSRAVAQSKPPSAQDFANAVGESDAYEIAAARVAQVEAKDGRLRTFASQMIRDHMATKEALTSASTRSGLKPPPDSLNTDDARLLYSLQSLKGDDFDRAYLTQQVVAHQGALTVIEQYASRGTDTNLKHAAATALPMIRHHLGMAEQLRSSIPP